MSVAGDTAYLASGLVERIEANAILGFTDGMIIGNLVDIKRYPMGADTASWQVYNRGTHKLTSADPGAVTDGTAISLSEFGSEKKTATLAPYGIATPVYMDAIKSSVEDPSPKVGQFLGNAMGSYVDKTVAALFDDFNSGNDVGTSSVGITVDDLFSAITNLENNYAPYPWRCVLDPRQVTGSYGLSNDLVTSTQFGGTPDLADDMLKNGYIQSIAGLPIFKSRELYTHGTTSGWGCAFSQQAIGLAIVPDAGRDIWIDFDKRALYQKVDYTANAFFGVIELDDYWGSGINTKLA
jgi:hypothetical protein